MPDKATFSLAAVRDAVRRRVEQTSIRVVAEEIGMSPSGLHVLLGGSRPHAKTRAKLVEWYLELRAADQPRANAVSPGDVDAALRLLTVYVQQDGRKSVKERRIREIVRRFESEVASPLAKKREDG
jgi:hypothetical protein